MTTALVPFVGSSGRSYGGVRIDRYGLLAVVVWAIVAMLLLTSVIRFLRRRARWKKRERARSYAAVDDAPASTDVEPIQVRADGPPKSIVVLGDDDAQFRIRARAGVLLTLDDGTRASLVEGTPLKCTFPGFSIVTNASGKGTVGVTAGTTFFVIAKRPPAPRKEEGDEHPFRRASTDVVQLAPVDDRYVCRLDARPPERKRLAKLMPTVDPTEPPRWNPLLYPGIPIAVLVAGWWLVRPDILVLLLGLYVVFVASIEDAAFKVSGED